MSAAAASTGQRVAQRGRRDRPSAASQNSVTTGIMLYHQKYATPSAAYPAQTVSPASAIQATGVARSRIAAGTPSTAAGSQSQPRRARCAPSRAAVCVSMGSGSSQSSQCRPTHGPGVPYNVRLASTLCGSGEP